MFKFLHKAKNQKGMTIVELVVVIALIGVFLAAVAMMVTKGRTASKEGDLAKKTDVVISSLAEYKMYKSTMPTLAALTAFSGVATLTSYIPTDLQTWRYMCAAGGNAIVEIPGYENNAAAIAARAKLIDMGICDSTTAVPGATAVNCVIKQMVGNSGC